MFAISHTYISTKVTGRSSPLLVVGSILPDLATISSEGDLIREKIHNSPMEFFTFVDSKYNNLVDLAIGVRLHSQVGRGADFYSDDEKVGYAIIEGGKVDANVAKLLNIEEGEISLVLAHNFIEAAVDLNLLESHPHLLAVYKQSIKQSNLQEMAFCLSGYLEKEEALIYGELKRFVDFVNPKHFLSAEAIVDGIFLPFIKLKFGKDVDREKTVAIVHKAKTITKNTYLGFLERVVENMKTDFADLT